MEIRELQSTDFECYLKLIENAFHFKMEMDEKTFSKRLEKIKSENSFIYVGLIHDKIVATSKLVIETKFLNCLGHIEDVVVDNSYKLLGFGKQIVSHCIRQAKNKNCYKIVLNCLKELIPFYSSCNMFENGVQMVL